MCPSASRLTYTRIFLTLVLLHPDSTCCKSHRQLGCTVIKPGQLGKGGVGWYEGGGVEQDGSKVISSWHHHVQTGHNVAKTGHCFISNFTRAIKSDERSNQNVIALTELPCFSVVSFVFHDNLLCVYDLGVNNIVIVCQKYFSKRTQKIYGTRKNNICCLMRQLDTIPCYVTRWEDIPCKCQTSLWPWPWGQQSEAATKHSRHWWCTTNHAWSQISGNMEQTVVLRFFSLHCNRELEDRNSNICMTPHTMMIHQYTKFH